MREFQSCQAIYFTGTIEGSGTIQPALWGISPCVTDISYLVSYKIVWAGRYCLPDYLLRGVFVVIFLISSFQGFSPHFNVGPPSPEGFKPQPHAQGEACKQCNFVFFSSFNTSAAL